MTDLNTHEAKIYALLDTALRRLHEASLAETKTEFTAKLVESRTCMREADILIGDGHELDKAIALTYSAQLLNKRYITDAQSRIRLVLEALKY